MAKLDAATESAIPDAKFAAVYTTTSTKNGRTVRTRVRKLPIHDAAHVRNALARLDQTDLPSGVKASAARKIAAAAEKFGVK